METTYTPAQNSITPRFMRDKANKFNRQFQQAFSEKIASEEFRQQYRMKGRYVPRDKRYQHL
jgi:hypothetical protein